MLASDNLFGLRNSNRDFSLEDSWGKNKFSSSFPVALTCYLYARAIRPIFIRLDDSLSTLHCEVEQKDLFGHYSLDKIFFAFEDTYDPLSKYVDGNMPRIDLVVRKNNSYKSAISCLEVKLTALPDNATCQLDETGWGSELVIRPDTIVYLACLIADKFPDRDELKNCLFPVTRDIDLTVAVNVNKHLNHLLTAFEEIVSYRIEHQKPYVLQPVWKTCGKFAKLQNNCLDVFVWSELAFTRLFVDKIKRHTGGNISRSIRTFIWVIKMLESYADTGKMDHRAVLSRYNFGKQTDKAFAVNGRDTNKYLLCPRLLSPCVTQSEIKNIIRNGAQKFLSPERRLDALLFYTDDLFNGGAN